VTGPTGTSGFQNLGNVLRVDAVNGNDSTASVNGLPYLTVNAAITAIGATGGQGYTVWIMPGTYNLSAGGITIPPSTAIRGMSLQTTTLQMSNVTTSTTLVTMGSQTRIEDVTLSLSSATSGANLIGVYFPNTTTTSSKVRACVLNVQSTAGGVTTNVYGMYSDGTTASPTTIQSLNAVQRTTTNVTSNTGGIVRGYYFTSACQFSVRDVVVFATGNGVNATNVIGVETTSTSSLILLKTSTISGSSSATGTVYDIRQPTTITTTASPVIVLTATDLLHNTADGYGFGVNVEPATLSFFVSGPINSGAATHYLTPGTLTFSGLSGSVVGIPFNQVGIVFEGVLFSQNTVPSTDTITVNLYNSSNPSSIVGATNFASIALTNVSSNPIRFQNRSSTILTNNFLIVQLVTSASGSLATSIIFNIGIL
jgi:hypothetical protein